MWCRDRGERRAARARTDTDAPLSDSALRSRFALVGTRRGVVVGTGLDLVV